MKTTKKYSKSQLTPAKKKFAEVFAKTDNATEAVRQAYPELAPTTSGKYLTLKGHRLIANDNVNNEIEYQKNRLELLASKAVNRVEKLLDSDNEQVATANVWKTIEQVHGKATQKIEQQSTSVNISIDLTQTED